jgi:glucose-1-phosphate thymidylyltransferase
LPLSFRKRKAGNAPLANNKTEESFMKGVILAGGNGTRLMPLTHVTNKSLLPIYDRPMIYYPLELMAEAGIEEVLIVTGGKSCGDMMRILNDGTQFGLKNLYYTVQEKAGGISQALALAESFAAGDEIFVMLGDNLIFGHNVANSVRTFAAHPIGAKVFLQPVPDPERFGIAEVGNDCLLSIEEKPKQPKSNLAVTGLYLYDRSVFDKIRTLKPSARGELEVTDLNKRYLDGGHLGYEMLSGDWIDAGTFESMLKASQMAKRHREHLTNLSPISLVVAA